MTLEQYTTFRNLAALYQSKKATPQFVAVHLGLSPRHVRRLLKQDYQLTKRPAWNRMTDAIRDYVIQAKHDYPTRNCQWIAEMAGDRFEHSVSQSSVYRILKREGLLEQRIANRTPRTRFEAKQSGDLVQMDTCWGYWLKGERLCLILLLDDYSRYILEGYFFDSDSAHNNMRMIHLAVADYGIFRLLYTDNASFFKPIRHNKSMYQTHSQDEYESEITKACRAVGITHITHKPYQPQGKGKIERLFRFIQDRFIPQITEDMTIADVNDAFQRWMSWYNHEHTNRIIGCTPKKRFNPEGFTPLLGDRSLEDIFCHQDTRKVDKCNCFSYEGVTYAIPKAHCLVAYTVDLCIHPASSIRVWHNHQFICELDWQIKN